MCRSLVRSVGDPNGRSIVGLTIQAPIIGFHTVGHYEDFRNERLLLRIVSFVGV